MELLLYAQAVTQVICALALALASIVMIIVLVFKFISIFRAIEKVKKEAIESLDPKKIAQDIFALREQEKNKQHPTKLKTILFKKRVMITLELAEKEIHFDVNETKYNGYINELQANNKVNPSHNFCMRCVTDESKDDLKEILKSPGASLQIAGILNVEFAPAIEITVKKPSSVPSKSKQTTSTDS
jgi:hypothetical protein